MNKPWIWHVLSGCDNGGSAAVSTCIDTPHGFVYTKLDLLEIMIHGIKQLVKGAVCACVPVFKGWPSYLQSTASLRGRRESSCTCNSDVPVLTGSKQATLRDCTTLSFMGTWWLMDRKRKGAVFWCSSDYVNWFWDGLKCLFKKDCCSKISLVSLLILVLQVILNTL